MIEVAEVFRRFADDYLSAHDAGKGGASMLPSHRRAITDILGCRTEALGGHLWRCDACSAEVYSYHSCKNRSCPKCHTDQTKRWLEARKIEMLPCRYFHVTITVPEELRHVLRANQRDGYALLMKAAAEFIIEIARDSRYVGATVGVLAVLHTWTQQLNYHPHVHCLVTGGGSPTMAAIGIPRATAFWFRSRPWPSLCAVSSRPRSQSTVRIWSCRKLRGGSPGSCTVLPGAKAMRPCSAISPATSSASPSNNRIVGLDDKGVTIRHKDRKSMQWRTTRLTGHEFMRRFLQHVLPKGLHKVRYYGLWHPTRREHAQRARLMLLLDRPPTPSPATRSAETVDRATDRSANHTPSDETRICPRCQQGIR